MSNNDNFSAAFIFVFHVVQGAIPSQYCFQVLKFYSLMHLTTIITKRHVVRQIFQILIISNFFFLCSQGVLHSVLVYICIEKYTDTLYFFSLHGPLRKGVKIEFLKSPIFMENITFKKCLSSYETIIYILTPFLKSLVTLTKAPAAITELQCVLCLNSYVLYRWILFCITRFFHPLMEAILFSCSKTICRR